jgi:N-methylhydantoinase A
MVKQLFVAVDFAGEVSIIALCDGEPAGGIDSAGWPIRASVIRMRMLVSPDRARRYAAVQEAVAVWNTDRGCSTLACFSGPVRTGPCSIAESVGMSCVCVPRQEYVVSPRGISAAGRFMDYSRPCSPPIALDLPRVRDLFVAMLEHAADEIQVAGYEQDDCVLDRYAEVRHAGSAESTVVPLESLTDLEWLICSIRAAHEEWGKPALDAPIEILSLHLRCAIETPETFPSVLPPSDGNLARARVSPRSGDSPVIYDRARLLAGDAGTGPAVIVEPADSILIPSGWKWQINNVGHLVCTL